jgi:GNAT superfamily N-acetyltransferase
MSSSPVIRLATPTDAEALARLRYEFRTALDAAVEPATAFYARCTAWMAERLGSDAWRCWAAETPSAVVGAIWLHFFEKVPNPVGEPEAHGYLTNFYVRTDYRGAGLGEGLLVAALEECDRRHVHSVVLWPTPRSRSLYERHGFAVPRTVLERPSKADLHGHARSAV